MRCFQNAASEVECRELSKVDGSSMSTAGPSQFAQLFKRSKFATYDPSIAQIYTSYGGYAHRGEYGLKRPLPPTARGADPMIHVKEVDTREEQTEWATAWNQGKWVRRFGEGGAGARAASSSVWSERGNATMRWETDSDFDENAMTIKRKTAQAMLPNIEAMNEEEFQTFLDRLRSMRPQFKRFLRKEHQAGRRAVESAVAGLGHEKKMVDLKRLEDPSNDLAKAAQTLSKTRSHASFLAHLANKEAMLKPSSKTLVPYPHPNAGLSYTHDNRLQTLLTYPPLPGRIIATRTGDNSGLRERVGPLPASMVAVGGTLAPLKNKLQSHELEARTVHFDKLAAGTTTNVRQGEIKVRVDTAEIYSPPHVVGVHSGLGGAGIRLSVVEERDTGSMLLDKTRNPHLPGTAEYVAYEPNRASVTNLPPTVFNLSKRDQGRPRNNSTFDETLRGVKSELDSRVARSKRR